MNILLSVKHSYAWKIASGDKKYEYRRKIWTNEPDFVYVYAGRPTKQIIGRFVPGRILSGEKLVIWHETREGSWIDALDFFDYLAGVETVNAIEIASFDLFFNRIDPYVSLPGYRAVQSWRYLPSEWEKIILKAAGSPLLVR